MVEWNFSGTGYLEIWGLRLGRLRYKLGFFFCLAVKGMGGMGGMGAGVGDAHAHAYYGTVRWYVWTWIWTCIHGIRQATSLTALHAVRRCRCMYSVPQQVLYSLYSCPPPSSLRPSPLLCSFSLPLLSPTLFSSPLLYSTQLNQFTSTRPDSTRLPSTVPA